jgi:hypothetical protein
MTGPHLASFYVPWSAALAASTVEPVKIGETFVQVAGVSLPVVQTVLAIAGVLLARPLAPRRSGERGVLRQISVTLIMAIVAVAWAAQFVPGILFTFVVSIGLGFSGYALIETAGQQIQQLGKSVLASATAALETLGGKPK